MDMAAAAALRLMRVAGGEQGPDWETSRADARAALCLAHGVPVEWISSLGYDHTERAYRRVRGSWLHYIEQWGYADPWSGNPADADVAVAHGYWLAGRPDLAAGDDWLAAGAALHLARYPEGCGQLTRCALHDDVQFVLPACEERAEV
jgi:hypothetical protein